MWLISVLRWLILNNSINPYEDGTNINYSIKCLILPMNVIRVSA